jgi:transcriptional regulator with XRE-family HTH domain
MLYKDALGEVIRQTRKNRNLTMRDISDAGYISLGYLSEVERGRKEIASAFLDIVAQALGVNAYDLVIEAGYRMAESTIPDTVEKIDEYSDLMVS